MNSDKDSSNEREVAQAKFKRQFIGLIIFILAIIVILLSTGRGGLA